MAFLPVFHDIFESVRFGRVLLVEIAPGPPPGRPCRYCDVLAGKPPADRAVFSVPESAAKVVLSQLEHGAAVDAVVFGGPGEPMRHRGIGSILRRVRTGAHVATIVLTDGTLFGDRDVRRDATEADTVVAWLPAAEDRSDPTDPVVRRERWETHVEGIASLRREHRGRIALELPVNPGQNDGVVSVDAWRRAVKRVNPDRVFALPAPDAEEARLPEALERVRLAVHPKAGAFLSDGTPLDRRCFDGVTGS